MTAAGTRGGTASQHAGVTCESEPQLRPKGLSGYACCGAEGVWQDPGDADALKYAWEFAGSVRKGGHVGQPCGHGVAMLPCTAEAN